jgi:hypothetical protein
VAVVGVIRHFYTAAERPDSTMLAQAVIRDDVVLMHKRPSTPGPGATPHDTLTFPLPYVPG